MNVTVPLLGLADLTIVGHLGSARAMGAIAVGSMVFNVIYWLLGFLRMGTSGLTSQAYGRNDAADARRLLRRVLLISLALGLLLIIGQWPLRWLAMRVIHPSAGVVPLASPRSGTVTFWTMDGNARGRMRRSVESMAAVVLRLQIYDDLRKSVTISSITLYCIMVSLYCE